MNDFQAIADRVEIEALRAEFTDAVMMRDRPRLASLFTPDGVLRMPDIPVEQIGREEILAGGERLQSQWDFFVQNTHPGTIRLDGDTATGRAYLHELARTLDGREGLNYAVYHDRYRRTEEGWRFAERVYEVRYLDTSPLTGTAPRAAAAPAPTAASFTEPASAGRLERVAAALRANGFAAEILDDAAAARARIKDLIPEGAGVLTGASLRPSGCPASTRTSTPAAGTTPSSRASWPSTGPPAPTSSGGCSPAPTTSSTASPRSPRAARSSWPRAAAASSRPTRAAPPTRSGSSARRRWCPT